MKRNERRVQKIRREPPVVEFGGEVTFVRLARTIITVSVTKSKNEIY